MLRLLKQMSFTKTTATKKLLKVIKPMVLNKSKRILGIPGGTSAGKTISVLMFLIMLAQKDAPMDKTLTSIVSESIPHSKRGCQRDLKNILQEQGYWKDAGWNGTDSIYTFENGSKIEFFSSDNGDKLRGARRDRLFINEANNVTFDAFEQLEVRTKEFIILDWNPTNEFFWYSQIKPFRNDWEELTLTYKDNEALSQNIVDSIEQRKNRKGWWLVYGLGQLGEVDGKIYKDWAIIPELPQEAKLERIGVDFGYSNDPTAIVAVYRYNGGFILDEIAFQKELSNKQIADTILNYDSTILVIADSAEPKSIAELSIHGVTVLGAEKGKDSVANSIQVVQDQRVSVTQNSVNIIKEYRNFLWRTDKDGKILNVPEHGFKNSMDAIAYAIVSIIRIGEPSEQQERYIASSRQDRHLTQTDSGLSF